MTTELKAIEATKHKGMYQPPIGKPCWHTVNDAAKAMEVEPQEVIDAVSEQTDVAVIEGPAVAGMIELQCGHSGTGYLPYYE